QGLVDRVVDHLEHHVVQPGPVVHVADVHAGPLAHGLEAAQHGDLAGIVGIVAGGGAGSQFAHAFAAIGAGPHLSQGAAPSRRETIDYTSPDRAAGPGRIRPTGVRVPRGTADRPGRRPAAPAVPRWR